MFYNEENLGPILDILEGSINTKQREVHHPEGNVQNHTLQVFSHSLQESNDIDLVLAALVHDVGKTCVDDPAKHEMYSVQILEEYSIFSEKTIWLVANHVRIRTYIEGEMRRYKKTRDFSNHPWFVDSVKLFRWDRMGRKPNRRMKFDREEILKKLNNVTSQCSVETQGEEASPKMRVNHFAQASQLQEVNHNPRTSPSS